MKRNGFTLIELLTTVTISGILISSSLPSLFGIYQRSSSEAKIRSTLSILKSAREYAVSHNTSVFVCGSNTGNACDKIWNHAIIAFIDMNNDNTFSADDTILFTHQFSNKNSYFYSRISSGMLLTQFDALGAAEYAGSFVYCPKGKNKKYAHRATWNRLGRSYKGRDKNGDGFIDDTSQTKISCS